MNSEFSNTFVNDCFNLAKEIESEASILNELSLAFYLTGNEIVSSKLYRRTEKLTLIAEKIRKICGDKVDKDFQEVQAATGNMIKAALNLAK